MAGAGFSMLQNRAGGGFAERRTASSSKFYKTVDQEAHPYFSQKLASEELLRNSSNAAASNPLNTPHTSYD